LIASMSVPLRTSPKSALPPPTLWWLRLDETLGEIVAAGQLFRGPDHRPDLAQRMPTVQVPPNGKPLLAFLEHPPSARGASLQIALLRPDGAGGLMAVLRDSQELGDDFTLSPVAFSSDARNVTVAGRAHSGDSVFKVVMLGQNRSSPWLIARSSESPGSDRPGQ
jgi:hypothetical protein